MKMDGTEFEASAFEKRRCIMLHYGIFDRQLSMIASLAEVVCLFSIESALASSDSLQNADFFMRVRGSVLILWVASKRPPARPLVLSPKPEPLAVAETGGGNCKGQRSCEATFWDRERRGRESQNPLRRALWGARGRAP